MVRKVSNVFLVWFTQSCCWIVRKQKNGVAPPDSYLLNGMCFEAILICRNRRSIFKDTFASMALIIKGTLVETMAMSKERTSCHSSAKVCSLCNALYNSIRLVVIPTDPMIFPSWTPCEKYAHNGWNTGSFEYMNSNSWIGASSCH